MPRKERNEAAGARSNVTARGCAGGGYGCHINEAGAWNSGRRRKEIPSDLKGCSTFFFTEASVMGRESPGPPDVRAEKPFQFRFVSLFRFFSQKTIHPIENFSNLTQY
jgi:hypothetical protein